MICKLVADFQFIGFPVGVGIVEPGCCMPFVYGGSECGDYRSMIRGEIIAGLDVYGGWGYFG